MSYLAWICGVYKKMHDPINQNTLIPASLKVKNLTNSPELYFREPATQTNNGLQIML